MVGVPQGSIVDHCRLRAIDMSPDHRYLFRYSNFFPLTKESGQTLSLSPKSQDSNLWGNLINT